MTTTQGATARLDEPLARRPVEMVPLIAPGGAVVGAEIAAEGIGRHRKPVEWTRVGDVEQFGATWETTDRDWLPCTVVGIGVAIEPDGPAVYVFDVAVRLVEVGDRLTGRGNCPVKATPAASMDRYTGDDWEYAPAANGDEGDEGYCPDAYVRVWCLIADCDWVEDEGDWQPDGPEGIYRVHWREKHADEPG